MVRDKLEDISSQAADAVDTYGSDAAIGAAFGAAGQMLRHTLMGRRGRMTKGLGPAALVGAGLSVGWAAMRNQADEADSVG